VSRRRVSAFTLIEILVVVAIIAILALIVVPNYLEATVRARASRARADLRVVAGALEAYAVDRNAYPPNDGSLNVIPVELTTPVAYLSTNNLVDPFKPNQKVAMTPLGAVSPWYTYMQIVTYEEAQIWESLGRKCPYEAIDYWPVQFNKGALEKYGQWRLVCDGPDGCYDRASDPLPLRGSDILYDPSNGTGSFGNILRTQKGELENGGM
jgi:type II secretion system protein G